MCESKPCEYLVYLCLALRPKSPHEPNTMRYDSVGNAPQQTEDINSVQIQSVTMDRVTVACSRLVEYAMQRFASRQPMMASISTSWTLWRRNAWRLLPGSRRGQTSSVSCLAPKRSLTLTNSRQFTLPLPPSLRARTFNPLNAYTHTQTHMDSDLMNGENTCFLCSRFFVLRVLHFICTRRAWDAPKQDKIARSKNEYRKRPKSRKEVAKRYTKKNVENRLTGEKCPVC